MKGNDNKIAIEYINFVFKNTSTFDQTETVQ